MDTYQPSGRASPLFFATAALAVVVAAAVAGLYQLAMRGVIGFDLRAAFVVPLLYGAVLGGITWAATRYGHCRAARPALIAAVAVALVGWAVSYYWDYRLHDVGDVSFWEFLSLKRVSGWKSKSSHWDGGWVVFFWTLEALLVVPLAIALGRAGWSAPYCESCRRWARKLTLDVRGVSRDDARPALDAGDLRALIELRGDSVTTLALEAELCPKCATGWLTAAEKRNTTTGKQTHTLHHALIKRARMSPEAIEAFHDRRNADIGQKLKPIN
jgi:hypothetical protein